MALADRSPQERTHEDAGAVDALWLGVAQACSLIPGVSRNGATLAAARMRRFTPRGRQPPLAPRGAADDRGRHSAEGRAAVRAAACRQEPRVPFAAGAGAAFVSTLGSTRLIRPLERDSSLLPYALYRIALAGLIARRLSQASDQR